VASFIKRGIYNAASVALLWGKPELWPLGLDSVYHMQAENHKTERKHVPEKFRQENTTSTLGTRHTRFWSKGLDGQMFGTSVGMQTRRLWDLCADRLIETFTANIGVTGCFVELEWRRYCFCSTGCTCHSRLRQGGDDVWAWFAEASALSPCSAVREWGWRTDCCPEITPKSDARIQSMQIWSPPPGWVY
jgi:hypothetical protein